MWKNLKLYTYAELFLPFHHVFWVIFQFLKATVTARERAFVISAIYHSVVYIGMCIYVCVWVTKPKKKQTKTTTTKDSLEQKDS